MGADTMEKFVAASAVAKQLGIGLEVLLRMSDRGEFARYYLFGKRKFYLPSEVAEAIRTQVPGDPARFRRVVAAMDAICPHQGARRRRAAQRPARGSSAPAS